MSCQAAKLENYTANYFTQHGNIVMRQNSPTRNIQGFTGHRKPDLITISEKLKITIWELKSTKECSNIDNDNREHMWFRHPTPTSDYIADIRKNFRTNRDIATPVAAWCIVLAGQLKYYLNNHPLSWKHCLEGNSFDTMKGGIVAPRSESQHILNALKHLNWSEWKEWHYGAVTFHTGYIPQNDGTNSTIAN
ncbi:MAG: hypothetical protein PF692_12405 [Kiritimatiellae bacterium]|jgi:hypothetical protein|nr:hypothetical protein [Kiritimatiellia bacterium]